MMQSAIIRERVCLLQQQQDIKLLAVTITERVQRQDHPCEETSSVDFLDMEGSTRDSAIPGPSLALKGANDFLQSHPHSESTVVCDSMCLAASSHPRWVLARRSLLITQS